MIIVWHFLVHVLGVDYGLPYGQWGWYNFWSGVAGSFLVGAVTYLTLRWLNGTCHDSPWCLRHGRYEAAGGVFKTCWRHHPDSDGSRRPHRELIRRLHQERS